MSAPLLAASLRETPVAVADVMAAAAAPWWIITGAAAALHDIDTEVADVDVLLDVGDARTILAGLGLALAPGSPSSRYRSKLFARWHALPVPVEFMSGFEFCGDAGWWEVRPHTRDRVEVDGRALFVPGRRELAKMFLALGRPKDLTRARLLTA